MYSNGMSSCISSLSKPLLRMDIARYFIVGMVLVTMTAASVSAQSRDPVIGKTFAESRPGTAPMSPDAKGAPNVIWILIDDVGFGASSAFGGPAQTPVIEKLAKSGLRYTNFHTTGVCSPSRAAMLTGRNHHKVGMGLLPQKLMAAEFPGYTGRLDPTKDGTIAHYLHQRGYGTYFLGKSHLTPDDESTDLGPFDRWPSGLGFDHALGFHWGETDQYKPDLFEDNQHVQPDGRHLNTILADKAISYVDRQVKLAPDKPFFMFFSTGATHSPHQVDREWIDKYKGKFDEGWDVVREKTFARQRELGVISANTKLPPRSPRVPAWDSLSTDQRKVYARFMEAYAGYFEQTDYEIGRFLSYLEGQGMLENTAIFVVLGDNGADIGGGPNGEIEHVFPNELTNDNDAQMVRLVQDFEKIGTGEVMSSYPMGWSQAMNTPYRDWKTQANAEGGTRTGMVVNWPRGITKKGEVRTQYTYLTDLLPTTLEIAGATVPDSIKNVRQTPIQGTSLVYSFENASAPEQHTTQYYFLYGGGGIYHNGWKASFGYRPDFIDLFGIYPSPQSAANNAGKEIWELYNVVEDPTELNDLAKSNLAKLKELKELFDSEARANQVYPLINWSDLYPRFKKFQEAALKRK
jgi:arylsulfatase A-like enzyme